MMLSTGGPRLVGAPDPDRDLADLLDELGFMEMSRVGTRFDIIKKNVDGTAGLLVGTVHLVGNGLKATHKASKRTCWVTVGLERQKVCLQDLVRWLHQGQRLSMEDHQAASVALRQSYGMRVRTRKS